MSKATQYATNDDNIFKDLDLIKMKSTQASLQASITLPKQSSILAIVIFPMKTFIGCEMYNKIDPSFSLCIIDKGAKKWRRTFDDSSLFECKLTILIDMFSIQGCHV
jgi:hypothetical protein